MARASVVALGVPHVTQRGNRRQRVFFSDADEDGLHAVLGGSSPKIKYSVPLIIPVSVPGIDSAILNPRDTWADGNAYDAQAARLAGMFRENFKKFEAHVGQDVLAAAPVLAEAAE